MVFFDPSSWMYFYNRPLCEDDDIDDTQLEPTSRDKDMAAEAVRIGFLKPVDVKSIDVKTFFDVKKFLTS